jgi:hypothetical protein
VGKIEEGKMGSWTVDKGPGTVVGGRFTIESLVHAGRMGGVFRARDGQTGRMVALKVLEFGLRPRPGEVERFLGEAEALKGLRHEGIAAYVDHGHGGASGGEVYLVTEWLEGEDLRRRLGRKPLCLSESLTLVRRVAEALAEAHGRGVVHGELRPSKLLLREGLVEGVTLLDYGITSANLAERTVMGTGEIVATLRYLAPEQARGERPGASADVYALGCVLFECLTGRVLYPGEHAAVVLTQILYEEVPRLGRLRPDLAEPLGALLERMLAKRPEARVADGKALRAELEPVKVTPEEGQTLPGVPSASVLVGDGQSLMSVVLAMPHGGRLEDGEAAGGGQSAERVAELERLLEPHGAQVEGLADGSVIMTLSQRLGTATDQAAQAARAALVLRQRLAGWAMALTTGRGTLSGAQLMGEAVRQAAELLEARAHRASREGEDEHGPAAAWPVWLDELTAGLLDPRFIVRRVKEGVVLDRERTGAEEVRLLLGRRTPCVGREQELELLSMQLRASVEESVARGVLVLAAAGMGKSRLRQEFLQRVEEREEGRVTVLLGRGDPMRGGGAYSLLGQALLEHCGLGQATGEERRRRFAEVVGRHVDERERQLVVEFLGEMCGVPFADEHSPQLRAARQDPQLMNEQVTAAWVKLLRAECTAHPVLLVLEDLHWSDRATVRLVEVALRELGEERLMVLGLARPDVKEMFPGLWQDLQVQELRLPVLSRRASERLVQEMLGELATPEVMARIVEQAGGNALFLEELIRAAAEGREGQQSETVLAILQARFGRLEPGVRRLLEVASLIGETFWRGGVMELLGVETKPEAKPSSRDESEIERWLRTLVGAETILRRGTSRFAGETEYAFRHALMRDAAYGLLGEEERRAGHRRVASYLERMGERDLMVLAEHHRLGGDEMRAASYFAQAAVKAVEVSDLVGALRCVERGVACGAAGEVLGALRAAETWAQLWSGNFPAAHAAGMEALALLPPGCDPWYQAIGPLMVMTGSQGQQDALVEHARAFVAAPLTAMPNTIMEAGATGLFQLCLYGERELMKQMTGQLSETRARLEDSDARARGMFFTALVNQTMLMDRELGPAQGFAEQALACFSAAGDGRLVSLMRADLAFIRARLGEDKADMVAEFHAVVSLLEELRQMTLADAFLGLFAIALVVRCEPSDLAGVAEAEAMAERVLGRSPYPSPWTGLGQLTLAEVWMGRGELLRAEEAARRALPMFAAGPVGRPLYWAVLSRSLLAQGRIGEALGAVEEAQAALRAIGGMSLLDIRVHLAAGEVYRAAGNPDAAREALAEGARQMARRVEQITEAAVRERFLMNVRDNVRLRQLGEAG